MMFVNDEENFKVVMSKMDANVWFVFRFIPDGQAMEFKIEILGSMVKGLFRLNDEEKHFLEVTILPEKYVETGGVKLPDFNPNKTSK